MRHAVGDLFVDIDAPEELRASWVEDGKLLLQTPASSCALEISALTIAPKDPTVRDIAVRHAREKAQEEGRECIEVGPEHAYWQEEEAADESRLYRHCHVGLGNRYLVITASYPRDDESQGLVDPRAVEHVAAQIARSARVTHPAIEPVEGAPVVRDLVPSQRAWLDAMRAELRMRCIGPGLTELDARWSTMLATPPETVNATETVNLFGTALGDLLAESRHPFAWSVVTDSFGTTIAVVSDSPSRALIDPFSFVAKRFDSRAAPFFTDSIPQILRHLDEALGSSAT